MTIRPSRPAALLGLLCLASVASTQERPPSARVEVVTDTYFGQQVADPYRWMEARPPEFDGWMRTQDTLTRRELTALPGYAALAREVANLSGVTEVPLDPMIAGGNIFYQKRPQGETQFKLFVAPLGGGPERLLVDPLAGPLGAPDGSLDEIAPSPDGRKLVFGIARGGSEETTLHVLDVATGKAMGEAIDRARFAGPTWDPAGNAFYYNRLKPFTAGMAQAERFKDEVIYRHVLGTDADRDRPVFVPKEEGSAMGRDAVAVLTVPDRSRWSFAMSNSGVSPEYEWWVAPTAALSGESKPRWTKLAGLADQVGFNSVGAPPIVIGDQAFLLSFKNAPNWKLVRYDLVHPDRPPTVAVPEQKGVLAGAAQAKDGIYLIHAAGGIYSLSRFDPATGRTTEVKTPYAGSIAQVATNPDLPGLIYTLDAWTRMTRLLRQVPGQAAVPLTLARPFPHDLSPYISEELVATAPDGTAVPVSVVYRRGLKRDGSAPAIVEAYGAYGRSIDPGLYPRMLAWFDRGGIFAVVHVRGGGEFGERWHLAGKGATKPNTWRDFIAGVTLLQQRKYTSSAKTAGWGTSAGGIMIGRTITERPDLLGAAIVNVGMSDALRFEQSEGGPANIAEFGTVTEEAGFKALYAMSAYHHVVDGTRYPATLVTAGMNDHRVPAWEGGKMAARLQAAQADGGLPIRLRVEFEAGHGMGSSKVQYDGFYTDMMAFVLRTTGDPAFQPGRQVARQ